MSVKMDSLDAGFDAACMECASWALENGIWDGRPVSWVDAGDFKEDAIRKIAGLLLSQDQNGVDFHKMSANLAWMGASDETRFEIYDDIEELGLRPEGMLIQAGLGKSLHKFWKKHKVEILVGIAVVAVVTAIAIATISTGGAAAGVVAAAGSAALDDDNGVKKTDPRPPRIIPAKIETATEPMEMGSLVPPVLVPGKMTFVENGILLDGEFMSHQEVLQRARFEEFLNQPRLEDMPIRSNAIAQLDGSIFPSNHFPGTIQPPFREEKSLFQWMGEGIGHEVLDSGSGLEYAKIPRKETSHTFSTEGKRFSHCRIGGINGMDTSLAEAYDHAKYLGKMASDHSIDWVYNHTNGKGSDLAEIFAMNYVGYSPNTCNLLRETWIKFHEDNKDNPHAKYLFFCHSQGAIHTKNTLLSLPEEIRKRIIVIAIAPAAIIPKDLCYDSYNYACSKDVVPMGEAVFASILDPGLDGRSELLEHALDIRKELIIIDPHPSDKGMGHEFQNPIFKSVIDTHVTQYLNMGGEYE